MGLHSVPGKKCCQATWLAVPATGGGAQGLGTPVWQMELELAGPQRLVLNLKRRSPAHCVQKAFLFHVFGFCSGIGLCIYDVMNTRNRKNINISSLTKPAMFHPLHKYTHDLVSQRFGRKNLCFSCFLFKP